MSISTPLLPQDDDPNQGAPSLGGLGGTAAAFLVDHPHQQSPLEALIERSSEQARSGFFNTGGGVGGGGGGVGMVNGLDVDIDNDDDNLNGVHNNRTPGADGQSTLSHYSPYITLVAGTLCLLQVGLVWGSFLAVSWFDTHLILKVELPVVKTETDQVIHSTTLATLLSTLLSSDPPQHLAATALMITSLVLPCLACVCTSTWTYLDRREAVQEEQTEAIDAAIGRRRLQHSRWSDPTLHNNYSCWELLSPRIFMEYTIRLSFLVFFLLIILNVGTSSMEINSNSTRFVLNNRIRGGLASYSLGIFCSLTVFLILRIAKPTKYVSQVRTTELSPTTAAPAVAPPDQAFQLAWNFTSGGSDRNNRANMNDLIFGTTSTYEEELRTPFITPQSHGAHDRQQHSPMVGTSSSSFLPFWKRAIVYEVGAVTTLLWFPALFLPLFSLNYDGIIADFMIYDTMSVRLWEFPAVLWQRCEASGTESWIMVALGTVLIAFVYVGPIVATILCIVTWTIEERDASAYCHRLLGIVQPTLCGFVFAVSLYLALPAFESISEYAIDSGSNGICQKFSIITSDTCLRIYGHSGIGHVFLLAQSLSLEVFVVLTLVWKRPLHVDDVLTSSSRSTINEI